MSFLRTICRRTFPGLLAGLLFLCGCDKSVDDNGKKVFELSNGQSDAEVVRIMGEPTGRMHSGGRTMLLYPGGTVKLEGGKTVGVDEEFAKQFVEKAKRRNRKPWEFLKKIKRQLKAKSEPKTHPPKPPARPQPRKVSVRDKNGNPISHGSLVTRGKITVVDFYATWCGPCRRISPILEGIARNDPDVVLRKVDIENWNSRIATQYNVSSVPNLRVFDRKGRLVGPPSSSPTTVRSQIEQAKRR